MRRLAAVPVLAALALAGCGGTATDGPARRDAFILRHGKLKDEQLARLCPSLYPSDFLANPKKYGYTRDKTRFRPTAAQRADARRAGCTARGTKPKG
jgi:hypothetical protein